jgi:hypothetical protein
MVPSIEDWFRAMTCEESSTVEAEGRGTGSYRKHRAGWQSAQVEIVVEPHHGFSLEIELPGDVITEMGREGFLEAAAFGIYDVLMVEPIPPVRNVRVRIVGVQIDPVASTIFAFRMAARDAARRALSASHASFASALHP